MHNRLKSLVTALVASSTIALSGLAVLATAPAAQAAPCTPIASQIPQPGIDTLELRHNNGQPNSAPYGIGEAAELWLTGSLPGGACGGDQITVTLPTELTGIEGTFPIMTSLGETVGTLVVTANDPLSGQPSSAVLTLNDWVETQDNITFRGFLRTVINASTTPNAHHDVTVTIDSETLPVSFDAGSACGVGECGSDLSAEGGVIISGQPRVYSPAIDIEKWNTADGLTNGDFDTAPGKQLTANITTPITFTITNTGDEDLVNVNVSDTTEAGDPITDLDCDFTTAGGPATGTTWAGPFKPTDSFDCTGTVPAMAADTQHSDTAHVTAVGEDSGTRVGDDDAWHGFTTPVVIVVPPVDPPVVTPTPTPTPQPPVVEPPVIVPPVVTPPVVIPPVVIPPTVEPPVIKPPKTSSGHLKLAPKAWVSAECVTQAFGEASVWAKTGADATKASRYAVTVNGARRTSIYLKPGAHTRRYVLAIPVGATVRVVSDQKVLASATVRGASCLPAPPPHTGFRTVTNSRSQVQLPERLTIPSLGVDVPLISTRTAAVPMSKASLREAFRWSGDGDVGDPGSVLVGLHSNRSGYGAGNSLPSLKVGQFVTVTRGGEALRYRIVRATATAPLHTSPAVMAAYRTNLGPSRIVLTTCNRNNLDSHGEYQYRSLAFGELVG